jgi:phage shock protein A
MNILVGGIFLIILAGLVISGKLRVLIRGFLGLFVEDMAKTPEGARAVYQQAIEEEQDKYNQAHDQLQKIEGEFQKAKDTLKNKKQELKDCESKCERLVQRGNESDLEIFAEKREDLVVEVKQSQEVLRELKPLVKEARQLSNHHEKKLKKLKKKKKKVVRELERNQKLKEMYDDMDELKETSNVDHLLESVDEGVNQSKNSVKGAKKVHNNKISTKIKKANAKVKKGKSSDYIKKLKNKHK